MWESNAYKKENADKFWALYTTYDDHYILILSHNGQTKNCFVNFPKKFKCLVFKKSKKSLKIDSCVVIIYIRIQWKYQVFRLLFQL